MVAGRHKIMACLVKFFLKIIRNKHKMTLFLLLILKIIVLVGIKITKVVNIMPTAIFVDLPEELFS